MVLPVSSAEAPGDYGAADSLGTPPHYHARLTLKETGPLLPL